MSDQSEIHSRSRNAGQLIFILGCLAFSIFLLLSIPSQTKWIDGTKWAAQPRLWPLISLIMMTGFGAMHFILLKRRRANRFDWVEAKIWLQPLEYAAYFMIYVWTVPIIGFLLCSMIFPPLLCYRAGYRDRRLLAISSLFGAVVVIAFKSFLSVKIPGAWIYEFLPDGLRTFFILNL